MERFDIKKEFNEFGWNAGFKFHIKWSNSGVASIWINDRKTKYKAGGYGYDKVSTVIADMINDLIGKQPYDVGVYGNSGNYNMDKNEHLLSHGVGFESTKASFESLEGAKLNALYYGGDFNVYEIKFPENI